jgi:16S rRNA (adenine1518-N6/adenine1519-N6)-dimethyltransferase
MAHPKKKWGQNFLRNRGAVDRIVAAVEPQPDEVIVEIGPGEGVLTEKLAALGNRLIALEIDPELASTLIGRLDAGHIEIRNEDAIDSPLPDAPFRAVGNLPYNVGTPILRRVIADPNCRRAVFMLQKEVAERLVAKPRDEQYGYLTLYTRVFARARILMTLEPKSFYPPPKVRSAVVVLDPDPPALTCDRDVLLDLISASFRMRRKKLVNNLLAWQDLTREEVLDAMRRANIGENVRAEELGIGEFDGLSREIMSNAKFQISNEK